MSSLEGEALMAEAAREHTTHQPRSETRDDMRIDWDAQITMDDDLVLRADVFRPIAEGRYPVILSYGPYAPLEIEIWPTSIVVPPGYLIALTVLGKDCVYPGGSGGRLSNFKNELTGCGPFLHDDPRDRPAKYSPASPACISAAPRGPICCCPLFRQSENKNPRKCARPRQ